MKSSTQTSSEFRAALDMLIEGYVRQGGWSEYVAAWLEIAAADIRSKAKVKQG